jgi:hypothetical protein
MVGKSIWPAVTVADPKGALLEVNNSPGKPGKGRCQQWKLAYRTPLGEVYFQLL